MEGLWAIIDSLSVKHKKWIADRLNQTLTSSDREKKDEVIRGIVLSVKEAKAGKTSALDTIWDQL